jgi:hypothetical protein
MIDIIQNESSLMLHIIVKNSHAYLVTCIWLNTNHIKQRLK